ncbi:MAG: 2-oxo acid dehydrogenase subunit E2 [Chloroflexi bacterium]|jgi:pyruvate dehydrogenase E2 component (dihydrolipoamide acetyltransferase)|uniref:Dihydrolipoamide acetyltransferase component of pyruvate dehydrogenase complex n=1 Tax=Candidatus Thermofonsia Clade 3 bacterium TaxID=2364212 RepID=A0A2M8QCM5_9CHLR|nr:dihydrolipoamide acetyltransferase family protein [Candidatus Roseilinea sp. NK_OTU-006]PJF47518.1 MAG: 2-oxo acid dehydrogenase subunit E2 [Candidatus Thermofonsia Clade 3 bacterium]RMG63897.1 MAG: 2-oxo acid dehydrogenase subunit E2 [Chloroflexota bacterium]
MPTPIIMPKFEMAQESGTVARWLKQVGEPVTKGEAVLEVETDKITMEVESPADGILESILAEAGAIVPIGQPIAYIAVPGEVNTPSPASPPVTPAATTPRATPIAQRLAAEHGIDLGQVTGSGRDGQITRHDVESFIAQRNMQTTPANRVAASPAARRLARERGVNLAELHGSGPGGRIQSSDVARATTTQRETGISAAVTNQPAPARNATPTVRRVVPLAGMRRTIAQRMSQSTREAPQFNLSADVNMSRALAVVEDWRATQTEGQPRLTLTALLVKVCAWALQRNPALNAGFENESIVEWGDVNIGVAVALDEGLIVPVIHHADRLSLIEIAARLNELTARGRAGQLQLADVQGGTFTLSNLGMFAVDRFTAIVNPPQAAILAVGRAGKRMIVDEQDRPVVAPVATLTVSADHRIVDGAQVGRFLSDLQRGLERPGLLL